jgi:cytochrome c553
MKALLAAALAATLASTGIADAGRPAQDQGGASVVPAWLFPRPALSAETTPPPDAVRPLHVSGSSVTYTEAQLWDRFSAPDWFPGSHSAMPDIVANGRRPAVNACGYCHTPGGQGRPENASLAGLPAPYIIQQVADFRSGARRSACRDPYLPTDLMIAVAANATAEEVASAATYFSQQKPTLRVRVIERDRVPRAQVVGWVYTAAPGGADETLGRRLLEFAPDPVRHELRDDTLVYLAYVPRGSVARGRSIALTGGAVHTVACVSCHGERLQGTDAIPRIAGRSPSYLLRQLLAFRSGARAGANGRPMLPVVARLNISDMIDAVAYAASLEP